MTANSTKFGILWCFEYPSPLPIKIKFAMREWINGVLQHISSWSVGLTPCRLRGEQLQIVPYFHIHYYVVAPPYRWRGGATGRELDLRSTGRGFKSYSGQSCVTTLGSCSSLYALLLSPSRITWYRPRGQWMLCGWEGNGSLPPGGRLIVSHLRADCLYTGISSGHTLGNEYGREAFTFYLYFTWNPKDVSMEFPFLPVCRRGIS